MPLRNVIVLSDRPDRGVALAEAAQAVARCRVSDAAETWVDVGGLHGVIADVSLERSDARHCLKVLADRLEGQALPLIYLARSRSAAELGEAKRHGATACLSAMTLPGAVVTGLFRQIAPDKTMTELMVEHAFGRAAECLGHTLDAARDGRVEREALKAEVDPIRRALREGNLCRWLELIRAHDDTTVRHCLLVAGLAAHFAMHLGLPVLDCDALVRAALLHDVGKARMPLHILNKPGPLGPDELAVMRTHAAVGHEMLLASGEDDPITLAVTRHHHEMLDGSGYPDGLRDGEISDPVRLLTICDIYAALTEARPYRPAMGQSAALKILRGMTPDKLECALVEAFAASLSD